MSQTITLTKPEARRFLVRYHGLDKGGAWQRLDGILAYFERVGAIQYDPLDVVGRNPDLVLQSRIEGYTRNMIETLLYRERLLVDHWDKQMSIHLAVEWPHRRRVRVSYADSVRHWLSRYRNSESALEHVDAVHKKFAETGPILPSKLDFGDVPNRSGWGSNKVAGVVAEYLAAKGDIGIHSRRGTQKVYDRIENLLPPALLNAPDPFESEHEFLLWYAARRIDAVGLAANRNGCGTWLVNLLNTIQTRALLLDELVERGRLHRVSVDGLKTPLYMPAAYEDLLNAPDEIADPDVRFLAPLDNMLFDRKLIASLFDFDYGWEVYVPAEKRRYGYYVLPVLYGDRLVARFEPHKHRGNAKLEIKNWWWEPGIRQTPHLRRAVAESKKRFQKFLVG